MILYAKSYKMGKLITILSIIFFYTCVGNSPGVSNENNNYNKIINMYSGEYFIGVGTGKGSTKEMAIKIAKARALGELADNVKVTIMSKLEVISTEITVGDQSQVSESVKEKIISLGNATVRSPEYEILNVSRRDAEFHAEVLAKKLIIKHVEESARDLEFNDDIDKILELIK